MKKGVPHGWAFIQEYAGKGLLMLLFFLFMFLKPFYLQPSGNAGSADVCLAACFVLLLGQKCLREWRRQHRQHVSCRKQGQKIWRHRDFLLICFLVFVIIINLLYGLRERNREFLKYSVYWLYNGCAVWTWRAMADRYGRTFFRAVNLTAKSNLVVQYVIWMSGRGRIFHEYWGAVRYMGTFNDPNQMAFFLFMMLLLIWLYRCRYGDRSFWVFLMLTLPMLADSKSTGVWLGMIAWACFGLAHGVYLLWKEERVPRRLLAMGGVCLLFAAVLVLYGIWPPADFDIHMVEYNLLTRLQEKIWKVMNGGLYGLAADRGAGRLFAHPGYLLMGAGEGGFARFEDAGPINELHSTWLSIWFCYGVVSLVLLGLWLRKILRANTPWMWCAVGALIAESFFLIHYRQPMFWMILLYADVTAGDDTREARKG